MSRQVREPARRGERRARRDRRRGRSSRSLELSAGHPRWRAWCGVHRPRPRRREQL